MHTPTHQDGGSHAQAVPPTPTAIDAFLQRYPGHNFTPLLELVTTHSPDGYEAFFNQVAELVCRHFGDGEWDNAYLLRMTQELFRFRDAFRGMRSGDPCTKKDCRLAVLKKKRTGPGFTGWQAS